VTLADVALCSALAPAFASGLQPSQRQRLPCVTRWFQTVMHQPPALKVTGEVPLWDGNKTK